MNFEILGKCPCCFNHPKRSAHVDIYAAYNENGSLNHMCIFGDDDFDVGGDNVIIRNITLSKDWNKVEEIVCPRCRELVAVDVPLFKEQKETKKAVADSSNEKQR